MDIYFLGSLGLKLSSLFRLLENDINKGGSGKETRLKTRLRKNQTVIGGRDGNSKL